MDHPKTKAPAEEQIIFVLPFIGGPASTVDPELQPRETQESDGWHRFRNVINGRDRPRGLGNVDQGNRRAPRETRSYGPWYGFGLEDRRWKGVKGSI